MSHIFFQNIGSRSQCAETCRKIPECKWFSFDEEAKNCFAMESCMEGDPDYTKYYSGKAL